MPVETHETTFQRNPATGMHRAVCTCGWTWYGKLDECQRHAAGHDIAWEAVEPAPFWTAPQP